MYQHSTNKILSQLEAVKLILASVLHKNPLNTLSSVPIVQDELFLIVPIDHRLAGVEEVDLAEVADDPFVLFKHETAVREVTDKLCHEAGFHPNMSFEGFEESTVAGLVGAKFGVAIIPYTPGLDRNKISLIRIRKPHSVREIRMVWRTNGYMPPAVDRFKCFVEQKMKVKNK